MISISILIAYMYIILLHMHRTSDITHIWVLDIISEVGYDIGSPISYRKSDIHSYRMSDIILEVRYTCRMSDIYIGSQIYISEL